MKVMRMGFPSKNLQIIMSMFLSYLIMIEILSKNLLIHGIWLK